MSLTAWLVYPLRWYRRVPLESIADRGIGCARGQKNAVPPPSALRRRDQTSVSGTIFDPYVCDPSHSLRRVFLVGYSAILGAMAGVYLQGMAIHVVLDNYGSHKHPKVRAWLTRHPRWTFHFTPTPASWLNAVEGFFSALTRHRLRQGTFTGIIDLQAAIKRYIAEHNRTARPFAWTKPATAIFDALNRAPEPSV